MNFIIVITKITVMFVGIITMIINISNNEKIKKYINVYIKNYTYKKGDLLLGI